MLPDDGLSGGVLFTGGMIVGKQLLQEVASVRFQLIEGAAGSGKHVIRGEFAKSDVPTANNRLYPRKIWEREINKLRSSIEGRKVFCEADHPSDGKTKLSRSCGILTSLELTEDGVVMGEIELMNTTAGKEVKAICEAGGAVGVSSRGYGSTSVNESGYDVVQEDFGLMTFDCVADPAHKDAYPDVSVEDKNVSKKKDVMVEVSDVGDKAVETVAEMMGAVVEPKADEVVQPTAQESEGESFTTIFIKGQIQPGFLNDLERELGRDVAQTEGGINVYTKDKAIVEKAVELLKLSGHNVEEVGSGVDESTQIEKPVLTEAVLTAERERIRAELVAEMKLEQADKAIKSSSIPEHVAKEMAEKDSRIEALTVECRSLKTKNKELVAESHQFSMAAKEMGFSLYLERKLGRHPRYASIVESLGDLCAIESMDALKKRVVGFEQEAIELQEARAKKRREFAENAKKRIASLKEALDKEQSKAKKLEEERDSAMKTGLQSALSAYFEKRVSNRPDASEIRSTFDVAAISTKDGVDKLIESFDRRARNTGMEFQRIRGRLQERAPNAKFVEDSLKGTLISDALKNEGGGDRVKLTEDCAMNTDEFKKLAGLSR